METIRYRPVRSDGITHGYLPEYICKKLYVANRIDDNWTIEIYESEQEITKLIATEKPSVLWNK